MNKASVYPASCFLTRALAYVVAQGLWLHGCLPQEPR